MDEVPSVTLLTALSAIPLFPANEVQTRNGAIEVPHTRFKNCNEFSAYVTCGFFSKIEKLPYNSRRFL